MPNPQTDVAAANLLKADAWEFEYQQKSNPQTSNLELLTFGTYRIKAGATSDELYHRAEEAILFCLSELFFGRHVRNELSCLSYG